MSLQNQDLGQDLELVALDGRRDRLLTTTPGDSFPLGAAVRVGGINFCLYAPEAITFNLLLFDSSASRIIDTKLTAPADFVR
ncbi:hypothetical protein S7335_539 [Synechococcus sp. PCC 7335]|nr:hypothetical protein S7335_539 [Synechococcus sp. PCC 7335]